jgi:hypothetical protein
MHDRPPTHALRAQTGKAELQQTELLLVWCVTHGRLLRAQPLGGVLVLLFQLGGLQVTVGLSRTLFSDVKRPR